MTTASRGPQQQEWQPAEAIRQQQQQTAKAF